MLIIPKRDPEEAHQAPRLPSTDQHTVCAQESQELKWKAGTSSKQLAMRVTEFLVVSSDHQMGGFLVKTELAWWEGYQSRAWWECIPTVTL